MPTIQYREGSDFPELPVRTPLLVKVIESNYVTEPNFFFGKPNEKGKIDERETRDVVKVVMEVIDGEYSGSRIWKTFTASINEKAGLVPFIQACSDHELSVEELKAFDSDDLKGRRVVVTGEYKPGDTEHKFLKPTGYMRVVGGASAEAAAAPAAKAAAKSADGAKTKSKAEKLREELAALEASEAAAASAEPVGATSGGDDGEPFDPDEVPF